MRRICQLGTFAPLPSVYLAATVYIGSLDEQISGLFSHCVSKPEGTNIEKEKAAA